MKISSNFEISGKLTRVGPIETRVSKAGKEYQIREIELDLTDSQYPNIVPLQMFGKSATYAEAFQPGQYVTVTCFIKASQGQQGKVWVNVTAFYIEAQEGQQKPPQRPEIKYAQPITSDAFPVGKEEGDDLPF